MDDANKQGQTGDWVQVTVYAQVKEPTASGYWLNINGIDLAVQNEQVQRVIPLAVLSEEAQQILHILYEMKGRYIAGWTLGERLGGTASSIQAANVLHGSKWTQGTYECALSELVRAGMAEELPDLAERWRLVVKPQPEENFIVDLV
jgi:hypothetical protein